MACLALGLTGCSDDYNAASHKHVYGEGEAPYLRADVAATINVNAEFRRGHVSPVTIDLNDYAETIQKNLGMSVSDMLAGVSNGSIVFSNINTNRGAWDLTKPTYGANGWYYTAAGNLAESANVGTITLDAANKALVASVADEAAAGTTFAINVGFAIKNGQNFDDYVRFKIQYSVSDPGLIMESFSIPEGDYVAYELVFANHKDAVEKGLGMSLEAFLEMAADPDDDIAMYMVKADGSWSMNDSYTANGIGYWCDGEGNVQNWGDGCCYYVETWAEDGSVGIGRYPGVASGTQKTVHFVYASKSDASKFVELVCNATFE